MRWVPGRQGSGYFKFLLFAFAFPLFGVDAYILKYPRSSYIKAHLDPVRGKHYRLNIVLKKAEVGGLFYKNGAFHSGRINFFRPDRETHGVSQVGLGTRYVLSIGVELP